MPAPPYSVGTEMPSRPSSAICGQNAAIELVRAIELANPGRHLAARPLPDGLLEQSLLVGEVEVEHQDEVAGTAAAAWGAFRKSTSRKLVLSRNCSTIRSGSNIRWMSRFGSGRCLRRAAGYERCCSLVAIDDDVSRVFQPCPRLRLRRTKERQEHALRPEHPCQLFRQRLRRRLIQIVEDIPAQNAVDAARLLRKALQQKRSETDPACLRERDGRCPSTDLRR